MPEQQWKRGDWVIYRKQKSSTSPGPRASNVHPAAKGDMYQYTVDKFWVVEDLLEPDQVQLLTRRGKRHLVAADDALLRRAPWWQRLLYRRRYEAIAASLNQDAGSNSSSSAQQS